MTLLDTVSELIGLRSFSNIWFWLVLAIAWSGASQRVLGVPWDMIATARRLGGEADPMAEIEELTRIHVNRLLRLVEQSGLLIAALTAFVLTSLSLLGFVYGSGFSQALFLLGFPLMLVQVLTVRTARSVRAEGARGAALIARLARHRLMVQGLAMISIFVTAMWGMYHNMITGGLG